MNPIALTLIAASIAAAATHPAKTAPIKPAPKATGKPAAKPTAKPTATPTVQPTPSPVPTPSPLPSTAPTPSPSPEPVASPIVVEPPSPRPKLDMQVRAGRWFSPASEGGAPDWSFARPSWMVDVAGWWGDWGLKLGTTVFGVTGVAWQSAPFFPAGSYMADVQGRYRLFDNRLALGAGVLGLGFKTVGYGVISAAYSQPLGVDWLRLEAEGMAGANVSRAYLLDGKLGLGFQAGPAGLTLGYRSLGLQCGCDPVEPTVWLNGPMAELSVRF